MSENNSEVTTDFLLTRSISELFPAKEAVKELLESRKVSIYFGIDPTGPTLHVGHAIGLKKLQEFQSLGHKVILLIGDFTGMVGDPTDKTAARQKLTREQVLENAKLYKEQASLFLNFEGDNPAELRFNSEWHDKLSFADVLELASNVTVQQMLERDMFETRMKEGKPIYLHEFLYPLIQGYDTVAMDVDGELGGNDQMFNMLTGRTLMKVLKDKEKFVMTVKLLEDTTGAKMGKTTGNMITFQDSNIEMFGKVMSWTDGMIVRGFELCTYRTDEEIQSFEKRLESENPRDIKVQLAKDIVEIYHGAEAALAAEENFNATFSEGGMSEDATEITAASGAPLVDLLVEHGVVKSKNEFRRLVGENCVWNKNDDTKIEDPAYTVTENINLKIGKRRFVKITLS